MLKKTITYTDYDGNTRTEDHYFNLSKSEIIEMEFEADGGLEALVNRMIQEQDRAQLIKMFKKLILKSYGIKDLDGRRFVKSPEISESFSQTGAYEELFMELTLDENMATEFVNGIIPADMQETASQIGNKAAEKMGIIAAE